MKISISLYMQMYTLHMQHFSITSFRVASNYGFMWLYCWSNCPFSVFSTIRLSFYIITNYHDLNPNLKQYQITKVDIGLV